MKAPVPTACNVRDEPVGTPRDQRHRDRRCQRHACRRIDDHTYMTNVAGEALLAKAVEVLSAAPLGASPPTR